MRSAVVLPDPDGPTRTTNSPSRDVEVERVDRRHRRAGVDARRLLESDLAITRPPDRHLRAVVLAGRAPRAFDGRAELARIRVRVVGAERVEPEQRRADDRRRVGGRGRRRRADASQAGVDRAERARVARLEQAAAEHHLDGSSVEPEPLERRRARARRPRRPGGRRSPRRPRRRLPRRRRRARARSRARIGMLPRWIASASSAGVATPKCAGTACSRRVRGPRPSSLRAAARRRAARPTS